ncbi:LytTR family DNA-binding domain-containing protein [Thomasclavelia sp.]
MKIKETNSLSIQIEFETPEEKERILTFVNSLETKIMGYQDGKKYLLNIESIYYIEIVDKQTFIYTKDACYESYLWLYQLEEQLNNNFVRVNKSTICNMTYIESLKADFGSRIMVYLDNGDQILVSRTFAKSFKERLEGV